MGSIPYFFKNATGSLLKITYGYGPGHYSIDIGAPVGTPIYSCGAGKVVECDHTSGPSTDPSNPGRYVTILHSDLNNGGSPPMYYYTRYCHMDEVDWTGIVSKLNSGQDILVTAGQLLGTAGKTGHCDPPEFSHIHFDMNCNRLPRAGNSDNANPTNLFNVVLT